VPLAPFFIAVNFITMTHMRLLSLLLFWFPLMVLSETALEPAVVNSDKPQTEQVTDISDSEQQLNKIDQLVALGAPGLALHFIYSNQQTLSEDNLHDWLLWEHKRMALLVEMERWQSIVERVDEQKEIWRDLPLNPEDKNACIRQQIEASLQLNQPEQALMLLR